MKSSARASSNCSTRGRGNFHGRHRSRSHGGIAGPKIRLSHPRLAAARYIGLRVDGEHPSKSRICRELPIVVCTGKDLTEKDSARLARMAESVIVKDVQSPERLLDEVSLFLHLVAADLPTHKQQMLERLRQSDEALGRQKSAGRRRRRAKYFRLDEPARTTRSPSHERRKRHGGDFLARCRSGDRCSLDGYHDARNGRL